MTRNVICVATNTAVILRCSPFFRASLEGWAASAGGPSFETPRKRAAPQDDDEFVSRTTGIHP
jgi:hypothetical protein